MKHEIIKNIDWTLLTIQSSDYCNEWSHSNQEVVLTRNEYEESHLYTREGVETEIMNCLVIVDKSSDDEFSRDSSGKVEYLGDLDCSFYKPSSIFNIRFYYDGHLVSYRSLPISNHVVAFLDRMPRLEYSDVYKERVEAFHEYCYTQLSEED